MDISEVYKLLLDSVNKSPFEFVLTKAVCSQINTLSIEYSEVLLGLIFKYYIVENNKTSVTELDLVKSIGKKSTILVVPYGGRTYDNGKGPNFKDFNKHPVKLQKMIAAYIKLITE